MFSIKKKSVLIFSYLTYKYNNLLCSLVLIFLLLFSHVLFAQSEVESRSCINKSQWSFEKASESENDFFGFIFGKEDINRIGYLQAIDYDINCKEGKLPSLEDDYKYRKARIESDYIPNNEKKLPFDDCNIRIDSNNGGPVFDAYFSSKTFFEELDEAKQDRTNKSNKQIYLEHRASSQTLLIEVNNTNYNQNFPFKVYLSTQSNPSWPNLSDALTNWLPGWPQDEILKLDGWKKTFIQAPDLSFKVGDHSGDQHDFNLFENSIMYTFKNFIKNPAMTVDITCFTIDLTPQPSPTKKNMNNANSLLKTIDTEI